MSSIDWQQTPTQLNDRGVEKEGRGSAFFDMMPVWTIGDDASAEKALLQKEETALTMTEAAAESKSVRSSARGARSLAREYAESLQLTELIGFNTHAHDHVIWQPTWDADLLQRRHACRRSLTPDSKGVCSYGGGSLNTRSQSVGSLCGGDIPSRGTSSPRPRPRPPRHPLPTLQLVTHPSTHAGWMW